MFPTQNPTQTKAWKALLEHYQHTMQTAHMKSLFDSNPHRFKEFSILFNDLLFDFSKNIITDKTLDLLIQLATECGLPQAIEAQFSGEAINQTEHRPVLHTALRNTIDDSVMVNGANVLTPIRQTQAQMKHFCHKIHTGQWLGYTQKKIKYVVNIGIGGSDLGPKMVYEALKHYKQPHIDVFFVSNVDGTDLAETLKQITPDETLFLIASKTFTTQETMANAQSARAWFLKTAIDETHIAKHFVAISTNTEKVTQFGIDPANIFEFWDWVGGRFSVWSSIGLSVALGLGYAHFEQFLLGAQAADIHFREAPYQANIPVIMALLSCWYINFFNSRSEAVLPYDQYLHRFAAYLQQAVMESNGKQTDRQGQPVRYATAPIVWGEPGTNGQHAFYQLLHQGTPFVPADFIAPIESLNPLGLHHHYLLSNFFAQTEALMKGKTASEVIEELKRKNLSDAEIEQLLPYKLFAGNKPTNTFLLKKITPFNLGMLVAFYEHKILVQGVVWNIFSFDQWGVELGKELATTIAKELATNQPITSHDSSTNGLMNAYKHWPNG